MSFQLPRRPWLILGLLVLVPLSASAQPRLDTVAPVAVQPGTDVELLLSGAQLAGAHTLLCYRDGLEVLELKPVDANKILAKCRVDPNCPPGPLAIRLCTGSGISLPRLMTVTTLPVVAEQEPNPFSTPQSIACPSTTVGVITAEDVDVFEFEMTQGSRISAEVEGVRLGYQFYDPQLELCGPDGASIVVADDSPLTRQDPYLSIVAPATGRYRLLLRERSGDGGPRCHYALHLGSFPRPRMAFPGGGPPAAAVEYSFPADPEFAKQEQSIPPSHATTFDWYCADAQGQAPTPLALHISHHPNFLEVEPNQPREQANLAKLPCVLCGIIESPEDRDLFRFTAKASEVWTFRSVSRSIVRSPIDLVLRLHEAEGKYLTSNDDMGGPDSYLEYTFPADGDYMLEVVDLLGRGGPDFMYRVVVDRPVVATSLTLPPRAVNVSTTVTIPRGNRMAVLVSATRRTHAAEVELRCAGLPPGVTAELPTIQRGWDRVPILFRAASDAAVGAALVELTGESTVGETRVQSTFQQRTPLAIGENNRDMWGHDADRIALSVNPAAPLELMLDQQPDPLLRNGEKQLKVRIVRQDGFTGPVQVQMVFVPPGVSAPGNIVIPERTDEAMLPLTATATATLGEWPLGLVGQATVEGVRHEVSSELVTLRVAEPFFEVAIAKGRVKKGSSTELVVGVTRKTELTTPVDVELLGLPAGISAAPRRLEADQSQLVFSIVADEQARPGSYRSLLCRLKVAGETGPIVQTSGTGQLRVDP